MNSNHKKINRTLLTTLNFIATVIVIIALFYSFKQLRYRYIIVGVIGIFLMIIATCLECYFCRIVFKFPRVIKVHNFIISLSMMYAGLIMLITTISLNKAWNFVLVCTVICQVLYSGISIYALYYIFKIRRLNNFRIERSIIGSNQRTNNIEQSSIAYSPELQDSGPIFIPPELYNSDNEQYQNETQTSNATTLLNEESLFTPPTYTESARNLTDGLQYRIASQRTTSAPNIYYVEKPYSFIDENKEFYKRASSSFEDYGIPPKNCYDSIKLSKSSESIQYLDINVTTGAVSEYEMLYGQQDFCDDTQPLCNPYANMCSDNVF